MIAYSPQRCCNLLNPAQDQRLPSSAGAGAPPRPTRCCSLAAPATRDRAVEASTSGRTFVISTHWALQGRVGGRGESEDSRLQYSSAADDPNDLSRVADLPTLAVRVDRYAAAWSVAHDVRTLRAAFHILVKVGTGPGTDPDLRQRTIRKLAAAYLPLVPELREHFSCVGPLWACAKLGFWGGSLAAAVLERLGDSATAAGRREGWRILQRASGQEHANLWWSISVAPQDVVALAAGPLHASTGCLLRMPTERLNSQDCSVVLLAAARLQRRYDPLLDHLTACLATKHDASCQALANALYALGELAQVRNHTPRPESIRQLANQIIERLRSGEAQMRIQRHSQHGLQLPQQRLVTVDQHFPPRQGTGRDSGEKRPDGASSSQTGGFLPQHLSSMLLGCAKIGDVPTDLVSPLSGAAGQSASHMTCQALVNSLYALGMLRCTQPEYEPAVQALCTELLARLGRQPEDFVPQGLSNTLWALQHLQPRGVEPLVQGLVVQCIERRFAGFKPKELGVSIRAAARLGWTHGALYKTAMEATTRAGAMQEATKQDWANIWYALATARYQPGRDH